MRLRVIPDEQTLLATRMLAATLRLLSEHSLWLDLHARQNCLRKEHLRLVPVAILSVRGALLVSD